MDDEKLARAAQKSENKAIEELNDRFKASVRRTVAETDWSEIERRLQMQHSAEEIGNAVKFQDYDPTDLLKGTFGAASEISAANIADVAAKGSSLSFKLTDPNALKWLEKYGAEEIKYLSDSQRDTIKKIVSDGYRDGITYQQQAKEIRNCIGLDSRRAATLQKYSDNLFAKGKSEAEVWRLMERKGAALLNQRARNSAVQEATTAGARGFYETTLDACSRGILDPNIYEAYRIVTGDERLCPKCAGLAGESRRLPDGTYNSSGSVTPKLHLLCRCVEGVRENKQKKISNPISPYAPMGSTGEISEWAKKTYPGIKFAFGKMDVDALNPTVSKMHELFQRYPQVANTVEAFGQHSGVSGYGGSITGHESGKRVILLSKDYFSNSKDLLEDLISDVETEWHPKGTGRIDSVFSHEFGHVMNHYLEVHHAAELREFQTSVSGLTRWGDMPSRYAREKSAEAFAEGFSEIQYNQTLSEYAKRQKALLEKVFGS